jgi:MFS family permease
VRAARTPVAPASAGTPKNAFVPSLLATGLVVSLISSLGAPLIPAIARELHVSLAAAQWSLTVAPLVGAVTSPVVGRLGDGPHRRTVLIACLAIVTLGGVIAALGGGLLVLVAGRALQGLGLAILPLTMASARDHLSTTRSRPVIAMLSITGAAGVGLGYPITGLIAEYLDLSDAFWFGAVMSGLMLVLAVLFVPAPQSPPARTAVNVRNAVLIGGGVLALLLTLEEGPEWGWTASPTLGLTGTTVVLLALYTRAELRAGEPLLDLRLIRRRGVLTANVTAVLLGAAMYMCLSLMTQIAQLPTGLHESVFVAGLTLLPLSALSAVSNRLLPLLRRYTGPRGTIPIGCVIMAAGMFFFAVTGDSLWEALLTMGLAGLGVGITFGALPGLIAESIPPTETGSAMSTYQVTRYVGFSIGSALTVTLLRANGGNGIPAAGAYASAFQIGAALCLVTGAIAWALHGRADRAGLYLDGPNRGMDQTRRRENRDSVSRALERIATLVVRHLADRRELSHAAILVLSMLDDEGPQRVTVLAAAAGVSQPSMSQLIQRLEQQRLVTRVSDPDDGRAALIGITDAGKVLMADRLRAMQGRSADLQATLSAEDEASLTLAMHVALPIVERMIRTALQSEAAAGQPRPARTPESATRTQHADGVPAP